MDRSEHLLTQEGKEGVNRVYKGLGLEWDVLENFVGPSDDIELLQKPTWRSDQWFRED